MTPKSDEEIIRAYERFLDELLQTLRAAKVRTPLERLTEIVGGALIAKILRLSDAVLALCVGHHGHDTGLLLRTLILAYANLKFIAKHPNAEGAALRFMASAIERTSDARPEVRPPFAHRPS